jgi:hypothetical protein
VLTPFWKKGGGFCAKTASFFPKGRQHPSTMKKKVKKYGVSELFCIFAADYS